MCVFFFLKICGGGGVLSKLFYIELKYEYRYIIILRSLHVLIIMIKFLIHFSFKHNAENNVHVYNLRTFMRKPAFYICENKDADQLRGNRAADQSLCFHYIDSTIPPLSNPLMTWLI